MEIKDLNNDRTLDKYPKIKVFVSQPMTGISMETILHKRESVSKSFKLLRPVKDKLEELGVKTTYIANKDIVSNYVEIIDNLQEDLPADTHPLEYLGNDIKMIKDADLIFFCKDWEYSRGCNIEFQVAKTYGILMIFE